MHLSYLLLGLPLVSAGTSSSPLSHGANPIRKRDGKGKDDAWNVIHDLCGVKGHDYTLPICEKDSDCQRADHHHSNLAPSGLAIPDAAFKFGDGYCSHNKTTNRAACAVQVKKDDDLHGYCSSLASVWAQKVKGLVLVNQCVDPHDDTVVICDYYCDGKKNPQCNHKKTYQFPCANLTIGGTDDKDFGCPGSQEKLKQQQKGGQRKRAQLVY